MSAELEHIESKIAYLERATAELSDELYRQQQLMQALQARLERLADQLNEAPAQSPRTAEQERPPHY